MRTIRATFLALVLIILAISLVPSCSKAEFSASNLQAQPYVRRDGKMGLSLYAIPSSGSKKKTDLTVQMVVTSPDGNLSWSFEAAKVTYDKLTYYGSSDISMPDGMPLPKGKWSVDVINSDGSTVTLAFDVSYTDASMALENYSILGLDGPWFDEKSNLTVIP